MLQTSIHVLIYIYGHLDVRINLQFFDSPKEINGVKNVVQISVHTSCACSFFEIMGLQTDVLRCQCLLLVFSGFKLFAFHGIQAYGI